MHNNNTLLINDLIYLNLYLLHIFNFLEKHRDIKPQVGWGAQPKNASAVAKR